MPTQTPINPPPVSAPAASRTLTREDVLRLGQAGKPWEFLPIAAQAVVQAPHDQGLRFLLAANLARLGLRTAAQEQLAPFGTEHPDVAALLQAIKQLPPDAVAAPLRVACAAANLKALVARGLVPGLPASGVWQQWVQHANDHECFRTLGGQVVQRVRGAALPRVWVDHAALTTGIIASIRGNGGDGLGRIVMDGLCPALLKGLYEATPATVIGQRTRLTLVAADVMAFLDALSTADLRHELMDDRVTVFVGDAAVEGLAAQMAERAAYTLPRLVITAPGCEATSRLRGAVEAALNHQHDELERLHTQMRGAYARRDRAHWQRRYREAACGGPPLRVLIPTTRYSTVVQHAARDLAAALTRAGCTAEVMIEPDDTTQFSNIGFSRALGRLDPDLIVVINYPRAMLAGVFPDDVPFVCWLQDAMPHLFDAALGARQGPLDFLVGHTFTELFLKYGYPTERLMPISMVADTCKFHDCPVAADLAAAHTCDLAFVSHHSETPEALFERLCREMAGSPAVTEGFRALWPEIKRAAAEAAEIPHQLRLRNAAEVCLRQTLGREPDAKTLTTICQNAAVPLVDRILRHETLEWAAEFVEERGLSLHLYGRGWETHPTLAKYARGELAHGEALRASYRCAGVHLHVSGTALVHQRVVECFLSGGLCIPRMHRDALAGPRTTAELVVSLRPPDHVEEATGRVGYTIADHPELMAVAAHMARLGHGLTEGIYWTGEQRRLNQRRLRPALAADHDPAFLLGDLAETTFARKGEFTAMMEKALADRAWRDRTVARVGARARKHLTHDAFASRLLALLHHHLGAGALQEAV